MTTKRGSAAELPKFHEQAKELGRICEQLRPGTGGAIEHFMRMAFDEGVASAQARIAQLTESLQEALRGFESFAGTTLTSENRSKAITRLGQILRGALAEPQSGEK